MRSDFYTARGTHVYFKDDLTNDDIDVEQRCCSLRKSNTRTFIIRT